jgi:hypothetical protein
MACYLVKQGEDERLIEAPTKATAIRHYATPRISAEPATIADVHRLAKAGVDIETAGVAAVEEN